MVTIGKGRAGRLVPQTTAGCMAVLLLVFTVFFFFVSEDSVTHDLYVPRSTVSRLDSCWFFACGRAWMNGLLPYVDFADSKGPLLFLIYGAGYLLSPRDLTGVFLLSCAFYWVTLLAVFRMLLLLTGSRARALLLSVGLIPFLFLPHVHVETRAEDYALTFVALGLWQMCRVLYADGAGRRAFLQAAFTLGVGMGATLLIKWNTTVVFAVWLPFFLYRARQCGQRLAGLSAACLGGFLAVTLPFVAYFLWKGALGAFVSEYFLVTFRTIGVIRGQTQYVGYWTYPPHVAYAVFVLVCSLSVVTWMRRYRLFVPLSCLAYLLSMGFYSRIYYLNICNVFVVFGLLTVWRKVCGELPPGRWGTLLFWGVAAGVTGTCLHYNGRYHRNYFYSRGETPLRKVARAYNAQLASRHRPTVIYWHGFDVGLGFQAEALPGCKYWAEQGGATARMRQEQDEAVRSGRADFVVVRRSEPELCRAMDRSGYHRCAEVPGGPFLVYAKEPVPGGSGRGR